MNPVLLANKYFLLKRIAAGGMAEIFLAKQIGIDGFEKLVVVKRILPELVKQSEYVRMFLDEARTAADLRHPNIVGTFEVGEDHGAYFMVMEYLHGLDLRLVFRKLNQHEEKIPIGIAVGIVMEVCAGLHYAHKKTDLKGKPLGIVHRDISPQNVVLTFDGETKIVDFGIAQGAHLHEQDPEGVLKGKFGYMSPEQAGGHELDQRTDQFSLGIILHELTTMHRLFRRKQNEDPLALTIACDIKTPSSLVGDYPAGLESIVLKALSKDRAQRFEDCDALRLALSEFLQKNNLVYTRDQLSAYLRRHFRHEEELGQDVSYLAKPTLSHAQSSYHKTVERAVNWSHIAFGVIAVVALGLFVGAGVFLMTNEQNVPKVPVVASANEMSIEPEETGQSNGLPKFEETAPAQKPPEKKKFGRLKVVVEPWGEVHVNGKRLGLTPLAPQKMIEGVHTIRIKNARLGPDKTLRVVVRANQDTLVRHSFE